jgi:hypothetical protein
MFTHPHMIRKIRTFSIGNRSYQERLDTYKSVGDYFRSHFRDADMCFVASHVTDSSGTCRSDVEQMISEGHRRFYNVCGVFFENSIAQHREANQDISTLSWDLASLGFAPNSGLRRQGGRPSFGWCPVVR